MNKWIQFFFLGVMIQAGSLFADSINLFNDSQYTLKAIIYDANGTLMGEFILNARDASEWSNNQNFGSEMSNAPQTPYTVNWVCMSGGGYGSCNNVAAGSTVTAQGCGGTQECGPLSGASTTALEPPQESM